jgi:chemotaxis family two-component system sensor kinase Cph1
MFQVDLTNCDREPIHIPGKVQRYGFLVATHKDLTIAFCSDNVHAFIPVNAKEVLGKPLTVIEECFLNAERQKDFLGHLISLGKQPDGYQRINTLVEYNNQRFTLIINNAGEYYILEFEPETSNLSADLQQLVGRSLSEMLADRQLDHLLNNTVKQVQKIIGYERVMIYKFHDDAHGEVVAEARADHLDSWLGLHYPASDIPQQARELYKTNLVRLIADVASEPSDLLTHLEGVSSTSLNLTCSVLRAVSPIHIQYLKNMGVASSFSVSLMDQDKLWGLIACHNYTPRFINFRQRESAKLVGQVLSSAISFREQEEEQARVSKSRSAVETITRFLLRNVSVEEALLKQDYTLQDVINSGGAALYYENQLHTIGLTPPSAFILQLIDWLDDKTHNDIYQTESLPAALPEAVDYMDVASGVLACRLSPELKEYLIWFRPELLATVRWAGNPEKPFEIDVNGYAHISPRHSFAEWEQKIKNTSQAWTPAEIKLADMLRNEINLSISRKATELRVLNEKLRAAYAELDTFSYTISHDLKNPLTTIKSYSQLIKLRFGSVDKLLPLAERIEAGALRMQQMIEEVLGYSRVGQTKLNVVNVDMTKVLNDLKGDLLVSSKSDKLAIQVGDTPDITGDRTMIFQIFSNLIGNAVKYSEKAESPVVEINGKVSDDSVSYTIRDNGVGIDPSEHGKIFELFSRAKNSDDFEGTGVGLSIVKRMLEKHHAQIKLQSEPGKGSIFSITFPVVQLV